MNPAPKIELKCPFIGMDEDPATSIAYASEWNRCFKASPAATPRMEHQRAYCLSHDFGGCPVYKKETSAPLPQDFLHKSARRRSFSSGPLFWVLGILMLFILAAAYLYFSGIAAPTLHAIAASATPSLTPAPRPSSTPSPLPSPSQTLIPSSTPQKLNLVPTARTLTCGNALDTPIGADGRFTIVQIQDGQNLELIRKNHATTLDMISAVNYFVPKPLWIDFVMVIPNGVFDLTGIPTFKAIYVEEYNQTVASLAAKLGSDADQLVRFNNLDPECKTFKGWLIVQTAALKVTPLPFTPPATYTPAPHK